MTGLLVRLPPVVLVALGSGAGAVARVAVLESSRGAERAWLATTLVNVVGCLLAGFLYAWAHGGAHLDRQRLAWVALAITGFCGGYTTFSGFGIETANLLGRGQLGIAIGQLWIALLVAIFAGRAGIGLARRLGVAPPP